MCGNRPKYFRGRSASAVWVAGVIAFALAAASNAATFTPLGDLPGDPFRSGAAGVSPDGRFAVGSGTPNDFDQWATIWTDNKPTPVILNSILSASANAVNANGTIVVGANDREALRWVNGVAHTLGQLPQSGNSSGASDVSHSGAVVVGNAISTFNGTKSGFRFEAFRWTQATGMVGLGDLPGGDTWSEAYGVSGDGSVVVGYGVNADNSLEAYRWTQATGMVRLGGLNPQNPYSIAHGISSDGVAIVGESASATLSQPFLWTADAGMQGLGRLEGILFTQLGAVANNGAAAVGTATQPLRDIATYWDPAVGLVRLENVLVAQSAAPPAGWQLYAAADISDDGRTIVGWGKNPDGNFEAWRATLDQLGAKLTTASTASISQAVSTPPDPFTLSFDYLFQTTTGALTVRLAGADVSLQLAPTTPADDFATAQLSIDTPLLNLADVDLEFILEGPTGSQLLLDNITMPGLTNGSFLLGLNAWTPTGQVQTQPLNVTVIPEPSVISVMFLAAALLGLRRRPAT